MDPRADRVLSKVAPEEDTTADTGDEADVQEGLHPGLFLQGGNDGSRCARGLRLALAPHSTEPQEGSQCPGLLWGHVP